MIQSRCKIKKSNKKEEKGCVPFLSSVIMDFKNQTFVHVAVIVVISE